MDTPKVEMNSGASKSGSPVSSKDAKGVTLAQKTPAPEDSAGASLKKQSEGRNNSTRVRPTKAAAEKKNVPLPTSRGRTGPKDSIDLAVQAAATAVRRALSPQKKRAPLKVNKHINVCTCWQCAYDGVGEHNYLDEKCIFSKKTDQCSSKKCLTENGTHKYTDCPTERRIKAEKASKKEPEKKTLLMVAGEFQVTEQPSKQPDQKPAKPAFCANEDVDELAKLELAMASTSMIMARQKARRDEIILKRQLAMLGKKPAAASDMAVTDADDGSEPDGESHSVF